MNPYKTGFFTTFLGSILSSFFLGLSGCGGQENVNTLIGIGIVGLLCLTIFLFWRDSFSRAAPAHSRWEIAVKLTALSGLLIISCAIASALGWVYYYSPKTLEDTLREFMNGLWGPRCG